MTGSIWGWIAAVVVLCAALLIDTYFLSRGGDDDG